MAWSPELALQHEELDRQHRDLFRLLAAGVTALETGTSAEVGRAIGAFADAMLQHVATEEALMEESLYPDRARHRVAHEVFLADLQQLRGELAATGPTPQVGEWLRVRLPEWLRFHIAVNDAPFGQHLARRPVAARPLPRRDTRHGS